VHHTLDEKMFNIILLYITITGIFNGIILISLSISVLLIIDGFLFLSFIFFNFSHKASANRTLVLFVVFYFFISVFFLIYFFENNNYGFLKLLRNVIVNAFYFIFYISLFKYAENLNLNRFRLNLLKFVIFLEAILFILYLLYNKKNGIVGKTIIQSIIFQDFSGRFQGTFSEPSILGFFLGTISLCVLYLDIKHKYFISGLLIFILYYACGAKFALISLPFAFIISMTFYHIKNIRYIYTFLVLSIVICIISLSYNSFVNNFYFYIGKYITDKETTGTFVTRFSFIFISIKKMFNLPVGTGWGMNYEYFRDGLLELIPIAKRHYLSTFEIEGYINNVNFFASKETFSIITSSFGFIGLFFYIKYISLSIDKRYNKLIGNTLILFVFLQSMFSTSIIHMAHFPFILYSRMALNGRK
jgi:hypothetical protein